jgi:endo-1,3(4)-beta-glucanase
MVSGDGAMEARGNLMLGILKRTVNQYMLLRSDNTTHPPQFIKNMVSGIVSPSITFLMKILTVWCVAI